MQIVGGDVAAEPDGAAGSFDALVQFRQHAARLDMALGREEQRIAEAALQRRLELGQGRGSIRRWPRVIRAKRSKSLRSRGWATTSEPLKGGIRHSRPMPSERRPSLEMMGSATSASQ